MPLAWIENTKKVDPGLEANDSQNDNRPGCGSNKIATIIKDVFWGGVAYLSGDTDILRTDELSSRNDSIC